MDNPYVRNGVDIHKMTESKCTLELYLMGFMTILSHLYELSPPGSPQVFRTWLLVYTGHLVISVSHKLLRISDKTGDPHSLQGLPTN